MTYCNCHSEFRDYLSEENGLVVCNDIFSVMETLCNEHNPTERRLFIDSSKVSLKVVLLYNGNKFLSPVAHCASMKEIYENFKFMLEKLQCAAMYEWNICGDLKIIALILGLQLGYTKYCCFLCEWDSRDRKYRFIRKEWSKHESFISEQKNVKHDPFCNPKIEYLPS
ncbi:uncharacterized protein LOC142333843 [Lycorma delicatula]|uniref:uncharacterized protein LOC142333843 n=1 Tax=Lycorma delicatula TaxID=130591 RepID=UPI003F50ECDC